VSDSWQLWLRVPCILALPAQA